MHIEEYTHYNLYLAYSLGEMPSIFTGTESIFHQLYLSYKLTVDEVCNLESHCQAQFFTCIYMDFEKQLKWKHGVCISLAVFSPASNCECK